MAETQPAAGEEAQPWAVSYRASHAVVALRYKFFLVLLACIFILSTGDVIATQAVSPAVPVRVNSI